MGRTCKLTVEQAHALAGEYAEYRALIGSGVPLRTRVGRLNDMLERFGVSRSTLMRYARGTHKRRPAVSP